MGPDLLSLAVFVWGGMNEDTNEGAAPKAVLPKHCFLLLHKNAAHGPEELCASLGIVFPQNGEDC